MRLSLLLPITVLLFGACVRATPPADAEPDPNSEADGDGDGDGENDEIEPARDTSFEFNQDSAAFEAELAVLDKAIAAGEAKAASDPKSWLSLQRVAGAWLARARLSGSYDDYAKAEDAITRAFARAPAGAGPFLARAGLNFTLHRLDAVAADLDAEAKRIVLDDPTRASIESMRGDLAFARGQYAAAREHLDVALALDRTPGTLAKLALWHWRAGDFEQAEAHYLEADAMRIASALEPRAWTQLQLGLMDLERGRYADAFAHYRAGAAVLGGWWLLEEHIAEIAVLLGKPEIAGPLYDQIIARTGKAEFIDAKAELATKAGNEDQAAALVAEATAIYEAELLRFPEASYGHALDHFLDWGPSDRALTLAEANHTLRPNVEAKLGLARARLGVDDLDGAQQIIDEALATTYVSADLFWIAATVAAARGEAETAETLRAKALALNPRIAD